MKRSGYLCGLFFYLVGLPAAVALIERIPGISKLAEQVSTQLLATILTPLFGIVLAEIARRQLSKSGRKRQISNSLPLDQRTYPVVKQLYGLVFFSFVILISGTLLHVSILNAPIQILQRLGAAGLALLAPTEHGWPNIAGALLMLTISMLWLCSPLLPAKPPKHKIYTLEMYNPILSRIPIFSAERFVLKYMRKLIRTDFLNRFSPYTIFAGRIHCLHEGKASVWYVTYDERTMQSASKQRPLTSEHIEGFLRALRKGEEANASISHNIIADVVEERHLAQRSEEEAADKDPDLGDLTDDEIQLITATLAASEYDNVLTLDIDSFDGDKRSQQAFAKRVEEVAELANLSIIRKSGNYDLNIYRRDKKLTTKVLQFRVDPVETIRKTVDEYKEKIGPQHSLLYATLRGASGEHAEGFDEETETVADELEGLEAVAGGASALDHIEELNPSVQQMLVEAKGFGRVFDVQLGKESYQVITEWLKSGGSNPLSGWRLFRCSKVINSDGSAVARRYQNWRGLVPHLFGLVGLGKEWSHIRVTSKSIYNQDKLPLALLALDAFEANDFKNRRRILRAAPKPKS